MNLRPLTNAMPADVAVREPELYSGRLVHDRFVEVMTPSLSARLDRRFGLAIAWLAFGQDAPIAGFVPDSAGEDWYSGDCVFEPDHGDTITDRDWAETSLGEDALGNTLIVGRIATPFGAIEKILRFHTSAPRLDLDIRLHWENPGAGWLKLGHLAFLPQSFDATALTLNGQQIARDQRIAMPEGVAELSSGHRGVRIETTDALAPYLGQLSYRETSNPPTCRFALTTTLSGGASAAGRYREESRRFRFSWIGQGFDTGC